MSEPVIKREASPQAPARRPALKSATLPARRPASGSPSRAESPSKKKLRAELPSATGSASTAHSKKKPVAVFIFRRDLRLHDNRGLLALLKQSSLPILPVFFFNPAQIFPAENAYYGAACVEFMLQSLLDLNGPTQLAGRLVLLEGSDRVCLQRIAEAYDVQALGFNQDITPFAKHRDAALETFCGERNIAVVSAGDDYTLVRCDGLVLTGSGRPYGVFTPFYNKVMAEHVRDIPQVLPFAPSLLGERFVTGFSSRLLTPPVCVRTSDIFQLYLPDGENKQLAMQGGRTAGLQRLAAVPSFKKYQEERDFPAMDKTTKLSPYLKFGCVSVRELFWAAAEALGRGHGLVRECIWREFYSHVLYNNPHLVGSQVNKEVKNMPFNEKYATFQWSWNAEHWRAFKDGRVGVPLVDAAVRCLSATGWCHNRNRMVIANFAVKVLGVDWRLCERWYATQAVDYDVASNNGGWLWSSGQGADAQPYFRTFNAFRQSERFDAECAFIKQWVPQLAAVPAKDIHSWDTAFKKHPTVTMVYPPGPIVNIKEMTKAVIDAFGKFKD